MPKPNDYKDYAFSTGLMYPHIMDSYPEIDTSDQGDSGCVSLEEWIECRLFDVPEYIEGDDYV